MTVKCLPLVSRKACLFFLLAPTELHTQLSHNTGGQLLGVQYKALILCCVHFLAVRFRAWKELQNRGRAKVEPLHSHYMRLQNSHCQLQLKII